MADAEPVQTTATNTSNGYAKSADITVTKIGLSKVTITPTPHPDDPNQE